jgi:PqqD family protein of HPr-rel-A system
MDPQTFPEQWRLACVDALPVVCWDGDYVAYNPLSGNTHFLDIVSGEILVALRAGPATAAVLSAHLAAFLEVPNDAQVLDNTQHVLDVLDQLGLVEPAPAC